jgi:hypothetical protein
MKKLILLAMIGATLSFIGCANQGTTAATTAGPTEVGVAAGGGGVSGGGGGSVQMRHTPTKNIP